MSAAYVAGVIAGVLAGVAVVALMCVIARKKGKVRFGKCAYDERQQFARGKAFQAGFFTILIYEVVYAIVDAAGVKWCENLTGILLGLFLGVTVFAVVAITRDAYIKINERPNSWMGIWVVMILLNLFCGVRQAIQGELFENGMLTEQWMNWMCAVMFIVILIAQLTHNRKLRREELEE